MNLCVFVLLLLSFTATSRAADIEVLPDVNVHDAASLQEASRVLEAELKLAARPQTYVLIDLVTQTVQIKGRGIELHRISIGGWSATSSQLMAGTFRLHSRPAVVRRKIDPTATVDQEPLSLADMPIQYTLSYTPSLTVEILPTAGESPLQWSVSSGKTWWRQLQNWGHSFFPDQASQQHPYLQLTLSANQAQSLAWSLVDGMSLVIRRVTDK